MAVTPPAADGADPAVQLTTLPGWRQFVAAVPSVPSLLPEQEWLSLEDGKRRMSSGTVREPLTCFCSQPRGSLRARSISPGRAPRPKRLAAVTASSVISHTTHERRSG